jgi:hypothetical protein
MAQTQAVTIRQNQAVEVFKSMGSADAYVFVGVSLPADDAAGVGGIPTIFSRESELGRNAAVPVTLVPVMVGGSFSPIGFTQLLQPAEQLYAQLTPAAPVTEQQILVASVVF